MSDKIANKAEVLTEISTEKQQFLSEWDCYGSWGYGGCCANYQTW
ncbi:hypothetical protein [Nostoc sp.]